MRPARPALWLEAALLDQTTLKAVTPVTLSYSLVLTFPQSTTYFTRGIVRDVSATFVATTQSLQPSGGGANTLKITKIQKTW